VSLFTSSRARSVAALGEIELIARIRGWLGGVSPDAPFGIGDDCAVTPPARGPGLVTTDPVIHGRHFDDRTPARLVGAKLLKRNLSDIAAMGGRPQSAVISLALDPRTRIDWLEAFYRGLAECARRHRVSIVGGDVAQADGTFVATLTLIGQSSGSRYLTRQGARIGDSIWVTGALGQNPGSEHHLRFTPRLREGAWLARQPEVHSMMDVSDGLAKDLPALTPAGAEVSILEAHIPRRAQVNLRRALTAGEDYELLFALSRQADPDQFQRRWRRAFPKLRLSRLGEFVHASEVPQDCLRLEDYHGYEHLSQQ